MTDDPRPRRPRRGTRGGAEDPPPYTLYRSGPRLLRGAPRAGSERPSRLSDSERRPLFGGRGTRRRRGPRGPLTPWRVARWAIGAVVFWIALSAVLFLISAQRASSVSDGAKAALDGGGYPLWSASTVLVLGSDQRTKATHEPGASTSGPSRSDVMLLIRTGGGASARLSIPRDTVVDVPGRGVHKINAAYAYGGAALAIRTVKRFLGIPINHVVEVSFDNFPKLIDSMGGIDYTSPTCVVSLINGGVRNGGSTLRLHKGTHHLDGKQALILARTRHNACVHNDTDINRAKRQQALFSAMKSRLVSPGGFLRLPWISWNAPPAIRSDMGGLTLIGLFGGLAEGGTPATRVLKPSGLAAADGGTGLTVSDSDKRSAVAQFLRG